MSTVRQLVVDFLLWCCSCPLLPRALLMYLTIIVFIFGVSVYLLKVALDLRQAAMNVRKLHIRVGDEMLRRYHSRVDRIELRNDFIDDLVKCLCEGKSCEHSEPTFYTCHDGDWTPYHYHYHWAVWGDTLVNKVDAKLQHLLQQDQEERDQRKKQFFFCQ